ncbi:MAG: hypothetical protein NZ870_02635 [bacterium]|nr:hypothetical protein [bacterium]
MKYAYNSYRGNKFLYETTDEFISDIEMFFHKEANYFIKASRLMEFEKLRDALLHIST